MLRKFISATIAVQVLACSVTAFAEADKPAVDKVAADTPASDKATAGKSASDNAAASVTGNSATDKATDKAAAPAAAEEKITSVTVKGNHRIETAAIMQAVKVRAGELLDREKVDADIRSIFKLGYFRDVQARTEQAAAGVVLEYVVQERPIVREIKVEGAKEIKPDKVRDAVDIKPNTIYSYKDLQKGLKKVKKLYTDDGYYLAEVDGRISQRSENEVNVIISVKEGKKVLIQTISFDGNHAFPAKKLKKTMETSEEWWLSWLTGAGTYKEEELKNDVALIADLYLNNGYINVKVGEPKVDLLPDKSGLKVTIGITEGEQFKLGTIGFKGDLLENADTLNKMLKEKSGQIFSRSALRTDVYTLTDFYADKGYAFANASPLTSVHPDTRTVDIVFDMEKGSIVHIDRINISGNPKTRDKVIRRELKLAEGDLYSATAVKRSKQSVMNTGFFEEANLTTVKGSAPDKLDMNVDVKEKPTGTFSIGAGYSSLDGVIGQGSISQSNFLGLGLKATASVAIGARSKTYNLGLTDPYFLDSRWTLGGDLYRNERQYVDYTRRATGGDIKAGYPLTDTLSTFWLYKLEAKEIFNLSSALLDGIHSGTVVAPDSHSVTSAIQASLSSNTTDYHPDPTSGWINTLSIEFAGVGGTNRYLRYVTEHTYFYPVGWSTVASIRGTLGYIHGLGMEIPIDEKFYLGGIGSLRGYSPRTVCTTTPTLATTTDANGIGTSSFKYVYLGGQTEAVVSAEYTFPLLKEAGLKGVAFLDAGNSQDTVSATFSRVLASYGAGIRWLSPIGPLRLEYGIPINPRSGIDSSSGRLEFSIGTMF
ncbi:MAG TPA: outer membrane protein assembly factor BamA [Geomonas sp.]|nr:outer membrane protein assembly factor BamA [Geomonas sp.]